jgi:hypothetical protein
MALCNFATNGGLLADLSQQFPNIGHIANRVASWARLAGAPAHSCGFVGRGSPDRVKK